jgi:hypothetical protein
MAQKNNLKCSPRPPMPPIPPAPIPPKKPPIQFKRGTYRAFINVNPILFEGQPAFEIDTNRLKIGDGRARYTELPYIGEGHDGKSAYEIWKDAGHTGSVEDFLNSLVGPAGKSTYELWLDLGNEGTIEDFINSLNGDAGEQGPEGKSAFEVWRDDYMHDPTLTVDDFVEYLNSNSWYSF